MPRYCFDKSLRFSRTSNARPYDWCLKLAIVSGITQSTLNNIMSGRNKSTTVSTIKKICDGIEITVLDFFSSEIFKDLEQEIK